MEEKEYTFEWVNVYRGTVKAKSLKEAKKLINDCEIEPSPPPIAYASNFEALFPRKDYSF